MAVQMKTKTVYDFAHMEELQRVAGKTFGKKSMRKKRNFAWLWGALCMVLALYGAVLYKNIAVTMLCGILGMVLLVWAMFFYSMTAWVSCKAMGKNIVVNEFVFEDEEILAMQGGQSERYAYTTCTDLLETETGFYFLMGSGGLLLDKENLRGGKAEELAKLLEEKTGKTLTWVGRKKKNG